MNNSNKKVSLEKMLIKKLSNYSKISERKSDNSTIASISELIKHNSKVSLNLSNLEIINEQNEIENNQLYCPFFHSLNGIQSRRNGNQNKYVKSQNKIFWYMKEGPLAKS